MCVWLCVLKQKSFLITNTNLEQGKPLYYGYIFKYVYAHDKQSHWQVDQNNVCSQWALIPLSVFCASTNGSFDPWLHFSRTLQHTRLTPSLWSVRRGITRENCFIQRPHPAPASSETLDRGHWPLLLLSDGATCGVVKLTQLSVFLCFFSLDTSTRPSQVIHFREKLKKFVQEEFKKALWISASFNRHGQLLLWALAWILKLDWLYYSEILYWLYHTVK